MATKKVAEKVITTMVEVPFPQAIIQDPLLTLKYLIHQPGFIAIVSFLSAFAFKVIWDLVRSNSRETARSLMLQMFSAFSQDQLDARERHESKLSALVSRLENNTNQNVIDLIKFEHLMSKVSDNLTSINARVEKLERKNHETL